MEKFAALFFICLLLGACVPREVGQGMSSDLASSSRDAIASDQMRLPMTGASRTEHMLYNFNRPETAASFHNMRDSLLRSKAVSPEDPAYRAIPKQKSPFRQ